MGSKCVCVCVWKTETNRGMMQARAFLKWCCCAHLRTPGLCCVYFQTVGCRSVCMSERKSERERVNYALVTQNNCQRSSILCRVTHR